MLKQQAVTIGTDRITIQQFATSRGLQIASELFHLISGVGQGIGSTKFSALDTDLSVGQMVSGLSDRIHSGKFPDLVESIIRDSVVQPSFDQEWYQLRFAGKYADLLTLLTEILKLNYVDAFDLIKKKAVPIWQQLFAAPPKQPETEFTPS